MNKIFEHLKPWQKTFIASSLDAFVALIAFPLAYFLRYGQAFPDIFVSHQIVPQALLIISVQILSFHFYGMYRSIWRYSSIPDLVRLFKGVTLAIVLSLIVIFFYNRLESSPRSIFIINWLLLIIGLGGWRVAYRIVRDYYLLKAGVTPGAIAERIVIVGAGSAGEQLIREIQRSPSLRMTVVGVADDDPGKKNKLLHGFPVLGNISDLPTIISQTKADKAFIAIPSATGEQMSRIVNSLTLAQVPFKTLPSLSHVINGKVDLTLLRNVEPEDLLGRNQVNLDTLAIEKMLTGTCVMVTGAGGSIGSEICRQIAKFNPKEIVLFEMTELFLYELENEFKKQFPHIKHNCVIGDVRSETDLERAFQKYAPDVVFHAAAYKHVPMMEFNPVAAVKTNILGTYRLAKKAIEHKVEKFVLISTDKAVNPTNIMGATKRVAEQVCQFLQGTTNETQFTIVRFGNVLGSSGSVIPLFKKQVEMGGPVTVTDPNVERYFMSISEASQLVLQAGALGKKSEIYVLDMGKPMKIVDLAKQLITLAGLRVDKDIQIKFTGLRPGEKLYEELLFNDEESIPTTHHMLRIAKARNVSNDFSQTVVEFEKSIENYSEPEIQQLLKRTVPEYTFKVIHLLDPKTKINLN